MCQLPEMKSLTGVKQKRGYTRVQQELCNTSSELYTKELKKNDIGFRNQEKV